ncbi:uncharacterized protein RJT20DRAFT_128305 [Scheffersomyces xylosifermentans]|uniref:uncharacterized protein n=1 Tax=Scheffersomyces xylosifermentans TaxID=1304137 RepID=UPI00315DEB87
MDQYPIILYKLLRQWLIILPSKMHILTYLSDPIERTLMHLFRALTKILDHIFPAVMFYFLQSFSGGLSIWFDNTSDYKDHYSDMTEAQQNPLFQELRIIEVYCIRVASFFRKRSNILSMMFGDQRLKQELSPQVIQNNINEVMIKSFNRTQIRFYHYLHFPKVVSFTKTNAVLHNLHYRFNGNSLYYNNQSHYQHFLSNNSSKISKSILTSTNVDPIIRFHMHNLSKLDVEGTQEEQNLEVIDSQSDRNLRRPLFGADVSAINEYGSSTHSTHTSNASFSSSSASGSPQESVTSPSAPQGNPSSPGGSANPWTPVTYYTIFDDSFSKVLATRISKDYEELFKSAEDDDIVRSLNSINGSLIEIDLKSDTGLMKRDRDPLNIIMEMNTNPFKRRLQNLFTSTQIYNLIENFYNLRNQKLSKYLDHYTVATASSSNFDYESSSTALHQANKPELKQKHHKSAKKKAASKSGTRDSPELLHDANDNKTTSEVDNFYDDLNVRYFNL